MDRRRKESGRLGWAGESWGAKERLTASEMISSWRFRELKFAILSIE
jgi:hypothetical protein